MLALGTRVDFHKSRPLQFNRGIPAVVAVARASKDVSLLLRAMFEDFYPRFVRDVSEDFHVLVVVAMECLSRRRARGQHALSGKTP